MSDDVAGQVTKVPADALIRRLENEEFDLVAAGRALLTDPAWAAKLRGGHEDEIVQFSIEHMKVLT